MYKIGIDIGSTYTKYCIIEDNELIRLTAVKTPVRQAEYFEREIIKLTDMYPDAGITTCGYGRRNVAGAGNINELSALSIGLKSVLPDAEYALDIGGQDSKVIRCRNGQLTEFFVNDKCAAGSGMFLTHACDLLGVAFDDIVLKPVELLDIRLSSVCAVFAQSEMVELIAANVDEQTILSAVVYQILTQTKPLVEKIGLTGSDKLALSGGLTKIAGFDKYAQTVLNREVVIPEHSDYLSAVGCAKYRHTD